jgi:hypothetical protein
MPDSQKLEKAELRELDAEFKNEINTDKKCQVQFNPETLKVSFANQVATPSGAGDQKGTPARQFVGAGTTKLSLQLWFDVTAPMPPEQTKEQDVRKLTAKVAYFITPKPEGDKFVPPAVRFIWGSFQFDGIMESMEESLEFFSSDGRPLRASVTINLTQQKITELATTGRLGYYEELKASMPEGLLQLLTIPGLGPKKVKALYEKLKVATMQQLEAACKEGKVATLDGFGEKTQSKILEGIEFRCKYATRHHLYKALALSEPILEALRSHPDVIRCSPAGSVRRNKEVIGDVDFLVSSKKPVS